MNAGLVPETSLGEAPTVDQISTDTRHERHVHFPTNDYEEDRQIHLNLRSPPPPYEAKDDFLEELRLDLAIAEEGIWRLEWELVLIRINDELPRGRTSLVLLHGRPRHIAVWETVQVGGTQISSSYSWIY
ncbi:hypothetical protein B0H14DRAFT_3131067 [Mycena olivaceomarginata]|nr:hypothetical protein B0H14DRAFT_3131067 [Mycena olivaceomarginata]